MKRSILVAFTLTGVLTAQSPEAVDLSVISRIKTEAFENSRVMDTLGYLTDVNGPRLTASPGFFTLLTQHPIGFWFIFWGEFAERCSYYGMRAILATYMADQLGLGKGNSFL